MLRAALLLAIVLTGCAYPRHAPVLAPVTQRITSADVPPNVWQVTFVDAQIPPTQRSGTAWDEDGSAADPFIRFYVGNRLVWTSETKVDELAPTWNATLPRNVELPQNVPFRVELWDRDEPMTRPIGVYRRRGLPQTALPDADSRITLDGGATITMRVTNPLPLRGVGILLYEEHASELKVLEVARMSPAGRAGIRAGDRIVALGGQPIDSLGGPGALTALSQAQTRRLSISLRRDDGTTREIELDEGFVWLTM